MSGIHIESNGYKKFLEHGAKSTISEFEFYNTS
jgi:hypothetical protein